MCFTRRIRITVGTTVEIKKTIMVLEATVKMNSTRRMCSQANKIIEEEDVVIEEAAGQIILVSSDTMRGLCKRVQIKD